MRKGVITCSIGILLLTCAFFLSQNRLNSNRITKQGDMEAIAKEIKKSQRSTTTEFNRSQKRLVLTKSNQSIEQTAIGIELKNCPLNKLVLLLAKKAGLSFKQNLDIETEDYLVTGKLRKEGYQDPESARNTIHELAFQFGLKDYVKEKDLEMLTKEQVANYPREAYSFVIRRETLANFDQARWHLFLQPFLSPESSIQFNPQTGAVLLADTPFQIEKIEKMLKKIDPTYQRIDL